MKRFLIAAALAAAFAAFAQGPGPGYGPGSGPGPGYGPGCGADGAGGPGCGRMGPRSGAGFTPGWSMMTPEERTAHQEKMRSAQTYEECMATMTEHHKLMQERAAQRGGQPGWGAGPVGRGCESLKK